MVTVTTHSNGTVINCQSICVHGIPLIFSFFTVYLNCASRNKTNGVLGPRNKMKMF